MFHWLQICWKIRPSCIFLPKVNAYRRDFNETKYLFFLIKDGELLEKYNEIWEKVRNNIKKEFGSEPVYNKKYLKAKQKTKRRFSIFLFIGNFDWFCF